MKRLAAGLIALFDFLLTGLAVVLGLAGWRLVTGPIEIDFLTPHLERELAAEDLQVDVGNSLIRWDGLGRPIRLVVTDAEISHIGGPSAYLPAVALSLDAPALLHGQLALTTLIFEAPALNVLRTDDGTIRWALQQAEGDAPPAVTVPDAPALPVDLADSATWPTPLRQLAQVQIVDATIQFEDRQQGRHWQARGVSLLIEQDRDDLRARVAAEIAEGADSGRLVAAAEHRRATGETEIALRVAGLPSRLLADAHAVLAPLAAIRTRLDARASLHLGPGWQPRTATLDIAGETGQLALTDLYDEPVAIARLALSAAADFRSGIIRLDRAEIDLGGPRILAAGEMRAEGGHWRSALTATLSGLPVDLLPLYWPPSLNLEARAWTAAHIADGFVDEATLEIEALSPLERPADLQLDSVRARFAYSDLTVRYLDGLPPVVGVTGTGSYDGDAVRFAVERGDVLDLPLDEAAIAIANFHDPNGETIDIDIALSGPLASALQLLDSPRLGYASALGLDPGTTIGAIAARLRFVFPLAADLALDEVAIGVAANLREAGLGEVTDGVLVNGINGGLSLTGEGMELVGQGRVGGVSGDLVWRERFAAARGPPTLVTLTGVLDQASLADLGLDDTPIAGAMPFQATYRDLDRQNQSLAIRIDLSDAAIAIDALSYTKPPGMMAEAAIDLAFENRRISGPVGFSLTGDGLDVSGAATLREDGNGLRTLRFDRFALDGTRFVGTVAATDSGGYAVDLSGDRFDARRWLSAEALTDDAPAADAPVAREAETAPAGRVPWQVSARFGEVILGDETTLYNANLQFAQATDGAESALLVGRTVGGGEMHLEYSNDGNGGAAASLHTDDADAVLHLLGLGARVRSGDLFLRAWLTEDGARGQIRVDDFRVVEAPLLARLLAAMSLDGLTNLLRGEGLSFDRLSADLSLTAEALTIEEGRAAGGSLGLYVAGQVGLTGSGLDLSGTAVPAYGVNRAIGAIPLVGDLLTGGEGGGVIAFTYRATGPIDDPQVQVNPLSALAPGLLRRIFFMQNGDEIEPRRRRVLRGDDER